VADARIIDTSNYQHSPDWAAVLASGVAGGICKATEGLSYRDPTFPASWAALGQRNAVRGAYHFGHPDQDPVAQADFFLAYVTPLGLNRTDILVLDLETGTGNMDAFTWNFLVHVQAKTGITPMFYSYGPFIRAHLTDRRLATYPLWIAAYQPNRPPCPPPWTSYALWQHTDSARVPGISGAVDESYLIQPVQPAQPVTVAEAKMRVNNPVAAHRRPGAGPEQFAVMGADGALFCFNGAPYCDAYNAHSNLWGGDSPNTNRAGVGFAWDDDGWGYSQYFDDGARYSWRAEGH
jgi:GH25 family lysozyme M1 (1,4-beta-N-acetylmuramidase)